MRRESDFVLLFVHVIGCNCINDGAESSIS